MEENPNTRDPEYNTEAIHSNADDPWFTQEEPADETYHPYEEELMHEYAPQEREVQIGKVPAYTPLVNTGGEYEPEPYNPAPEDHNMHIVTYGTVEDVAFADGDDERRNGLVSMSIRDEMDDLIHTDFHTLNPLGLLDGKKVEIGDRVRVDIQDYKNVIEWFVYNYPTLLTELDLLQKRAGDGPWFHEDMQTLLSGKSNPMYGKDCIGGTITDEPQVASKKSGYEDWEHENVGSQLDKSYLEIGQRDGNKKITLRQFLNIIRDYFHLDEMWATLRDHEKRIVHLERDNRDEDEERNTRVEKSIGGECYELLNYKSTNSEWTNPMDSKYGWPSYFIGNVEQKQFSLYINYRTAIHEDIQPGAEDWFGPGAQEKGGKFANPLFKANTIPEQFRPNKFQWLQNYGLCMVEIGQWYDLINHSGSVDIGIDPDGSVWVCNEDLVSASVHRDQMGIFGINGSPDHMAWMGIKKVSSPLEPQGTDMPIDVKIVSFGGIVTVGNTGEDW